MYKVYTYLFNLIYKSIILYFHKLNKNIFLIVINLRNNYLNNLIKAILKNHN